MDLLKQKIAEKTEKQKLDTELMLQKLKADQIELRGNVTVDAEQAAEIRELLKMKELAVEAPRALIIAETDTARAGDFVIIEIQNEPDFPRDYIVQTDGTIRFPLLGSIRVQGLTARQIGESLGKQFKDRKLTVSGVHVTVRRER
jgi:protein involved in polysaccharide export with SLBB domain